MQRGLWLDDLSEKGAKAWYPSRESASDNSALQEPGIHLLTRGTHLEIGDRVAIGSSTDGTRYVKITRIYTKPPNPIRWFDIEPVLPEEP